MSKLAQKMTRPLLSAIVLLSASSPGAAQTVTNLDDMLKTVIEQDNVPGMAAAVFRGDTLLAYGAAGVREVAKDEPVSFASRWHIGSCTKAMTATMIGQLVHAGEFSWDTTVIDLMPELKGKIDPACEAITIKQLLTHTAGLPAYKHPNEEEQKLLDSLTGTPQEQRREFVEKLLASPPLSEPGTKFEYSNAGYGVVATLAEVKMKVPWDRLLYLRFGAGVALSTASTGWPRHEARPNQPLGHWKKDGECVPHDPEKDEYAIHPVLAPAGDLHCTIAELARFTGLHLRGMQGKHETWFSSEVMRELHTPVLENYACGWVHRSLDGREVEWHNGSAGTFFTWMTIDPDRDLAVVVATNCGDSEHACEVVTKQLLQQFAPMRRDSGQYGP